MKKTIAILLTAILLAGSALPTTLAAGDAPAPSAAAVTFEKTVGMLGSLLVKEVVICSETGCGIVPLDKKERLAREATGRLMCALAAEADTVVRMICGIPQVIKGEI